MEPLPSLLPDSFPYRAFALYPPHDSFRRSLTQAGIAVPASLAALLPCPALPGKQEEADRFPLPAGPLYTEQKLGRVAGCGPWQLSTQTLLS